MRISDWSSDVCSSDLTVTREGVLPLSETLDSVGVIARCVASCAAFFDVIRDAPGPGRADWPARRIRLGLVTNYVTQNMTDEVGEAVARRVAILERAGVSVEPIEIPELDTLPAMMQIGRASCRERMCQSV